jgi:SAM-dependent methyltransferase
MTPLLPPSCPACGNPVAFSEYCRASFLPDDERRILECPLCRLSVLWPLPTGDELTAYYGQSYFDFNRRREEGKGLYYAHLLKKIAPQGRFLDVGCATGFFLSGIQKNCSWELYGLETGREAAAYARKNLCVDVRDVPLEQAGYESDFFDFIHLNNVLEHTTDPFAVLSEAARILKKGGRLYVAVPNGLIDRRGYWKVLKKTGHLGASKDGHLFFFTKDSLESLAQRSGLQIQKAYSCGFKRGFRVLGLWPEKKGWERDYQGHPKDPRSLEQSIVEGRSHSPSYYLFKHTQENVFRYPGFSPWTYDFNLTLTK